ncbi:unnamed protein product [Clavelina lepadiformis]|uniref:Uncharacterized protein n=1 Tax=Clavelina lepadiformis TaxID=159417 RepID=A0ABP0H2H0_CLALP
MDISIDKYELEGFMHVDDENNEEYSQSILGDVNEVLETMQTENDDTDDEAGPSNDYAPVENSIVFHGFEQLYNKVLEVEDQLLCPALQDQAGGAYNNLKSTFECFQRKLRQVTLEAKQKGMQNMHQMTLHDMFKQ